MINRQMSLVGVAIIVAGAPVARAETPAAATQPGGGAAAWAERAADRIAGAAAPIDPLRFFEDLVGRYRCLTAYADSVHVVKVIERYGESPRREETQLSCEIVEGELRVRTPGSQLLEALGLDLPLRTGEKTRDVQRQRDLKLAPHLALKFAPEPLDGMQSKGAEELTPTDAAPVRINDRTMVQLQLRTGDGLSEDCEARFDLYVDPDSMLIERITGEERLPDGATQQTTMEITPVRVHCETTEATDAADAEKLDEQPPAGAGPDVAPPASPEKGPASPPAGPPRRTVG